MNRNMKNSCWSASTLCVSCLFCFHRLLFLYEIHSSDNERRKEKNHYLHCCHIGKETEREIPGCVAKKLLLLVFTKHARELCKDLVLILSSFDIELAYLSIIILKMGEKNVQKSSLQNLFNKLAVSAHECVTLALPES